MGLYTFERAEYVDQIIISTSQTTSFKQLHSSTW